MTHRTARTLAIATSVLSTTAVPVVLIVTGTWTPTPPAPGAVRQWIAQPLSAGFVTALTATAAAALWLLLITAVLTHAYRALGRRLRFTATLHIPGPLQSLTAALLGATAVTVATGATAHAAPIATSSDDLPAAEPNTAAPAQPATARAYENPPATQRKGLTYTVRRGDSLCQIAARTLGDADRWTEIYALNRGTRFPRVGGTLINPNLIYPGWALELPDDAIPTPGTRPHTRAPDGHRPSKPPHPAPVPVPRTPTAPATPSGAPSASQPSITPSISPTTRPATPSATAHTAPSTADSIPGRPAVTATPDPDAAIEQARTAAAPPTTPTADPAAASGSTPAAAPPDSGRLHHDDRGVSIPGGWVPLGLAAALAAAGSVVALRRRNRYHPTTDVDPAADPTLQPLPAVISRFRRAACDQKPHPVTNPANQPTVGDLAAGTPPALTPLGPSGPYLAGLPNPTRGGMGLTGPGHPDAVRAIIVATLSAGSPHDPDARGEVVVPTTTLGDLLGGNPVTDLVGVIPRLRVTAGLGHALAYVETQIIHRTRAVTDADVTDLDARHETDPHHELLPPIVLIADVPDDAICTRLTTALHLGHPLGITAIIAGNWPHGSTLTVAEDGHTRGGDWNLNPRLSVLDTDTTMQLLNVVKEAHTGQSTPATGPEQPQAAATRTSTKGAAASEPAGQQRPSPDKQNPDGDGNPVPTPPPGDRRRGKVTVRVLGEPAILDPDGKPVKGVRRASYELLTYLAVHRQGADIPDIEVAMTPDATPRRARDRLSTNVANLRNRLTAAAGLNPADDASTFKPVVNPGGRYYLDPQLLDIDWWRVLDATSRAQSTTDRNAQRAALEEAVDNWSGLLHDDNFEWSDAPQHTSRQVGINIHTQLAGLIADADADPARARNLLDTACDIDPINEETARLAMTAHGQIGNIAAVSARFTALEQALADIDEEPADETRRLANHLLHKVPSRKDPRTA
ncbi:BTAD domain-containing putative transcriptional regulator [Micromonospora aurantiaca (nom. illeg.)]|uniref:BTAD domain-containing putative transcriptional regulator n=1 Tax=Micromonospora aurantiaca (nom. illeg.) TaxID=47850 RepID=UPI0033FDF60E